MKGVSEKISNSMVPSPQDSLSKCASDIVADTEELFNAAYRLDKAGFREQADGRYAEIIESLETIHRESPAKCSTLDLTNIALNHGKQLFSIGRLEQAKFAFQRASELLYAHIADGVSIEVVDLLAENLHWLARCQRKTGDIKGALESYTRSIPLIRNLMLFKSSPSNTERLQVMFNTAVYGYSKLVQNYSQNKNNIH